MFRRPLDEYSNGALRIRSQVRGPEELEEEELWRAVAAWDSWFQAYQLYQQQVEEWTASWAAWEEAQEAQRRRGLARGRRYTR